MHRIDRRRLIGAAVGAAATSIVPSAATGTEYGIRGRPAPRLAVTHWIDATGRPMTFDPSSLDGRWVLLKFFQSWCPGCHRHGFPSVKTIHDAFWDEPRLRVLAVQTVFEGFSTNTADRLTEMQDRYDLRIPFGHDAGDPHGERLPRTMREYRSGGTPWIVIIDPTRRVVFNDYHLSAERFIDWLRGELAV